MHTLEEVKELVKLMVENKLDRIEFDGLVLCMSKHEPLIRKLEEPIIDPLKTLLSSVTDTIPDWIKENRHLIDAAPFKDMGYTLPIVKERE